MVSKILISIALLSPALVAQGDTVYFKAPPPPPVASVSARNVGNPGPGIYFYWIVTNYAGGSALPAYPAAAINAPSPLTGSNYVTVGWTLMPNATSYDVLRTATPALPNTGSCTCAVATAVLGNSVNDTGGALSSYTLTLKPAATGSIQLDNSQATPRFIASPTLGGGGTPAGVQGDGQMNQAGAFGVANWNQNADGSINASKAITEPAPFVPTFNVGGTTTCDGSQSTTCKFTATGATTLAFVNPHGSGPYDFIVTTDGGGPYAITLPGTFLGAPNPSVAASVTVSFSCVYDGTTNYYCQPGGTTETPGTLRGPTRAAPGTPPALQFVSWVDTVNAVFSTKANNSATITHTFQDHDCGIQFVQKLNSDGTTTCATAGGGSTPPVGGTWPIWGASSTNNIDTLNAACAANCGMWHPFVAKAPTMGGLLLQITTGAATNAKGLIAGVFATTSGLPSGSALCSGILSGAPLQSTGAAEIDFSAGSAFSAGVCNLTTGGLYVLAMSSDDNTLQIASLSNSFSLALAIKKYPHLPDSSTAMTTGTGASIAFTASATWTNYQGLQSLHWPVGDWWN